MNQEELENRLSQIKDKLIGIEHRPEIRIFLMCESENNYEVCKFLFEEVEARFVIATCIDSDNCYEILYHFSYDQTGCVITVNSFIRDRENPSIESIGQSLPGAEWIEREMHDEFGVEFKNHPDMRRLVLADDWPEGVYPLRREVKK
jgi:Ni,Fe-hydrogenase III component G